MCAKTPLQGFTGSKITKKKMLQNPGNAFSDALILSRFEMFD